MVMTSSTKDHIEPDPEPPPITTIHDHIGFQSLTPTYVRILNHMDHNKDIVSYDTDLYEGRNDGVNNIHLTVPSVQTTLSSINSHSSDHQDTICNTMACLLHDQQNPIMTFDDYNHLSRQATLCMRVRVDEQQMDSGANRSVTDDISILLNYHSIQPIPIYGVNKEHIACYIQGYGNTVLHTIDNNTITIRLYYAPECAGTILSPNAIVTNNNFFTGWIQTSHMDSQTGTITFFNRHEPNHNKTVAMKMTNNLWYIEQDYVQMAKHANVHSVCYMNDISSSPLVSDTIVHRLSKATEYELWHQRFMHAGTTSLSYIDKCTTGVPSLKAHDMHSCKVCQEMNIRKTSNKATSDTPVTAFGQRFQMDFGFMRAKADHTSIRSHDGYHCYLLIVDYYTRYYWAFLSKNKHPPTQTIQHFLKSYGTNNVNKVIRTDQGGELAKSALFRETIRKHAYQLEITGADNSSQNGIAERPHQTIADMVRAGLENAGLHVRFWSDALLHAIYVKNRLPHAFFNHKFTPYEKLTGLKPDLSKLRIFGSRIVTRKPGKRTPKISKHSYSGIFLRYAKTIKNIVYYDTTTKKIKTTTYAKFDEVHFSYENKPPGAKILMELGFQQQSLSTSPTSHSDSETHFKVLRRHPDATIPIKGTSQSARYDLHSISDYSIPPNSIAMIDTGIIVQFPSNTYGRIASRSGLVSKHRIEAKAGVIDPDYRGVIKVILHNFGDSTYIVKKHDRIAQLILENYTSAPIKLINTVETTQRNTNGFGSTGLNTESQSSPPHDVLPSKPHIIPNDDALNMTATVRILRAMELEMVWEQPVFTSTFTITRLKKFPTLGLQLKKDEKGPVIINCDKGSPLTRIPNWKKAIRHAILYSINNVKITNDTNISNLLNTIPDKKLKIVVAHETPPTVHHESGLPQMSFDQFVHVSQQHQCILNSVSDTFIHEDVDDFDNIIINKLVKQRLTRKKLIERDDWADWEQSEFLQLDQYERQNMFGKPGPLPTDLKDYSVLPMIWVYIIKTCGRKKARCVANGAPHLKGTITIANTYAACLDQSAFRLFWAICAIYNKIVFGSDAANAFAEAPPPKSPLYLKTDCAFRNWYQKKYNVELPDTTYVQVLHAIQGHPEAPRLWQEHIDSILKNIGFRNTHHEPCIYIRTDPKTGENTFLLRQVDDFAIGCSDKHTADSLWDELDTHLREPLKRETSYVTRHNGIDVLQTRHFIRIHCDTYINKIISTKTFSMQPTHRHPIPMNSDNAYVRELESTKGPTDPIQQKALEDEMGFSYRSATGELIFAMVMCRVDISFATIKLTQYNNCPARCHYEAVKNVYRHLHATSTDGLTFWRQKPNLTLPVHPWQPCLPESYVSTIPVESNDPFVAYCIKDSTWASDLNSRNSVGGILIMFGGAAIIYKTMIQRIVALSSTEAEFYALSEAGKLTLYIRSVLADLQLEQTNPTSVYEDNRGCIHITNASKPTKRMRHVETRHFAILQWVDNDLLKIKKIDTADNSSDVLTKATGRILFYRHNDTIMGRRVPLYVKYDES